MLHHLQHSFIIIFTHRRRLIQVVDYIILHCPNLLIHLLIPSNDFRRLIVGITLTDIITELLILSGIMPISTCQDLITSDKSTSDSRNLRIHIFAALIGLFAILPEFINISESFAPVIYEELIEFLFTHIAMSNSRCSLQDAEVIIVHFLYGLESIMDGIVISSLHIRSRQILLISGIEVISTDHCLACHIWICSYHIADRQLVTTKHHRSHAIRQSPLRQAIISNYRIGIRSRNTMVSINARKHHLLSTLYDISRHPTIGECCVL